MGETWVAAAKGVKPRSRGTLRAKIAEGRADFLANFSEYYASDQFPLRPGRILRGLRKALPEDGYVVTDVGWNKNGVAQQFPFTVPGTFITTSGLATMGFGPAAVLGVKYARPDRAAVSLTGDGGFSANMSVIATAMEAKIPAVWVVMDNSQFGTIAGLEKAKYDGSFGCLFLRDGEPYSVDYAEIAGFAIPDGKSFLIVKEERIGKEHLFSSEKLSPVLAIFRYSGFDNALSMVKQIYEVGGKGHSCGIYSFDDDHVHRLALTAPVSRMMVRQPQSKAPLASSNPFHGRTGVAP